MPGDDLDLSAALDSAASVMAFSSRDWSTSGDLAWLWGIFNGWDSDDPDADAMPEVAARFSWTADQVERLGRLRAAVVRFLKRPGSQEEATTDDG